MDILAKFSIGIAFVICVVMLLKEIGKWNPPVSDSDINGMPHKHGTGIGGWLLFLVFTLAITNPVFSVGLLAMSLAHVERETQLTVSSNLWAGMKAISWFFSIVSVLLSIYAARELLIKRHKEVISKVIKLIWISGPGIGILVADFLWLYSYLMMPEAAISSINVISILSDLIKGSVLICS